MALAELEAPPEPDTLSGDDAQEEESAGTELRSVDLGTLQAVLNDQHAHKVDMVAPAAALRSDTGALVVSSAQAEDSSAELVDGRYNLTDVAIEGIAAKLTIPTDYLRRLHSERADLFDANVNGWLQGPGGDESPLAKAFLVRAFRNGDGDGVARAFLSDRFRRIDHLDVLVSALKGVAESGLEIEGVRFSCDLTHRRMYVHISVPEVKVMAPALLAGYRSPFSGHSGADNPVVSAGFVITNSETGDGAAKIIPRITIEVCENGMTKTQDAMKVPHLGATMDHGVVRFSDETQAKNLELVEAQSQDAVTTFLDPAYLTATVADMEDAAQVPLGQPSQVIETVTKQLGYTQSQQDQILNMFIKSGDMTAGGVMNAITAAAQEEPNADTAADMEAASFRALELAASAAS